MIIVLTVQLEFQPSAAQNPCKGLCRRSAGYLQSMTSQRFKGMNKSFLVSLSRHMTIIKGVLDVHGHTAFVITLQDLEKIRSLNMASWMRKWS